MKKKKIGRPMALLLCMLLALTFTMPAAAFAEGESSETRYFDVNLFDYDQQTILEALGNEFPGSPPEVKVEDLSASTTSEPDYSSMFMFMGGRDDSGSIISAPEDRAWFSKWEKDHYVYQGLLEDSLSSSARPEYADGVLGIDLFDPSEEERYDAYKGVPFEFNYDPVTEIYSYSSKENSAVFDGSVISLGAPLSGGVGVNGFRPFGSEPKSALDHFGMSMEVEFFIPESGPEGLEFNFSGDDDVWVFVDGEMVLDLGGIHGNLAGAVTFDAEKAVGTLQAGTEVFFCDNGSKDDGGDGTLEITGDFGPGTVHTLKFFYLERGGNASNCSIEFNIPPTVADFAFIKADSNTERRLSGAVFRLLGEDCEGEEIDETSQSDEEGIVRFEDIPPGEYRLTETGAPDGYLRSDVVYLIRIGFPEQIPTLRQMQNDCLSLCVWYAIESLEGGEPEWTPLITSGDLWLWNDRIPVPEDQILTVKKAVTGNRAPLGAEYEFMILFFTDQDEVERYGIADDETEEGEIRNLSEIDTEWQEDGEYAGYYRFLLKDGQQITFDYGNYYNNGYEYAVKASVYLPALQFRLIETNVQNALGTSIGITGQLGSEVPAPSINGTQIQAVLAGDSEDVVIQYSNAYGNKDKDRDKDKEKDGEDVPVIPPDPEPQPPESEVIAPVTPAPPLPQTGGVGAALFIGIGSLMTGAGLYLRRR